jgi:hypothetical protein
MCRLIIVFSVLFAIRFIALNMVQMPFNPMDERFPECLPPENAGLPESRANQGPVCVYIPSREWPR